MKTKHVLRVAATFLITNGMLLWVSPDGAQWRYVLCNLMTITAIVLLVSSHHRRGEPVTWTNQDVYRFATTDALVGGVWWGTIMFALQESPTQGTMVLWMCAGLVFALFTWGSDRRALQKRRSAALEEQDRVFE